VAIGRTINLSESLTMENPLIRPLDPKEYDQFKLVFRYTAKSYYEIIRDADHIFSIQLVRQELEEEVEKEFEGLLFAEYLEEPSVFGISAGDQIVGFLEIARESWHNRLRITELLVKTDFRGQGYGSKLIDKAKEIMRTEGFRELVLETQSCNTRAIDFYLNNGFIVNGLDLSCYTNEDIDKKEVRLEMMWR
jgi:ribosomal protein S18 acetylase RimI-like enzyme